MVGLGEPVFHLVLYADAVADVRAKEAPPGPVVVLGQIGEGHAIVGQHDVDLVWGDLDHVSMEG